MNAHLSTALLLIPGLASCRAVSWNPFFSPGPPLPTVDGPEEPGLLQAVRGTILVAAWEDTRVLRAISLPELRETVLELKGDPHEVSGPDQEGRVVYLEYRSGERSSIGLHALSLVTGDEQLILERQGHPHPNSCIALSSHGARAALLLSIDRGAYDYGDWSLEVVDLDTGSSTLIEGKFSQHQPQWLPDGRHLAFVEHDSDTGALSTSVIDVVSRARRKVADGYMNGIDSYGRTILTGRCGQLHRLDLATGHLLQDGLRLPGVMGAEDVSGEYRCSVIAELSPDRVLYEALPTTGVPQVLADDRVWKRTVKLCNPSTGAFVTVVPYHWGSASYGAFELRASAKDASVK